MYFLHKKIAYKIKKSEFIASHHRMYCRGGKIDLLTCKMVYGVTRVKGE